MKWFSKKVAEVEVPVPVEVEQEKHDKPLYYSVTRKEIKWQSNDFWQPGQPIGWFVIKADIHKRGVAEPLYHVNATFPQMDDYPIGIENLQLAIHKKIKEIRLKDKAIASLYTADVVNNGLEWFIT